MSERSKDLESNDQTATLEELQSQLEALTASLDSEKKSKDRILEESKKYKEGYQSFKAKQDETDKAAKLKEDERLIKEGQFSTIIEQREAQIAELEQNLQGLTQEVTSRDTAIVNFKKAGAFERALGGKLKNEAYWNHVDFDSIAVNPETGAIDAQSLKSVTDKFVDDYKELIDFGNTPNLPNGTPSGKGKLTHAQWKALPLAERKVRMKDVVD